MLRTKKSHPILRWLLQLDQPVPARTEAEVMAEMQRNYRWNFGVNLLDGASFWFGLSFISSATIVPLFISKLSDSPVPIALAALIAQGSWYLPQLFTANYVEPLSRKKPVVVNLGFFLERLPLWVIVLAAAMAAGAPILALVLFLFAYAWHGLGAGLIATAWQDLLARCFPVDRRGRLLGITLFVGAAVGLLAAGFSAHLLANYPFPTNFVTIFAMAALGITVSWFFIALTREPVQAMTAPRRSNREFWRELPELLRRDHNFRHFLVARLLLALGGMAVGFVTVAAIQRFELGDGIAGGFTAAFLIGQTVGNLVIGFMADRYGHKLSLELAALCAFLAFGLAFLAPSFQWYFVVFVLLGVMQGAVIVSGILVVMEFSPPEKRPTYTGLTNTSVGVVSMMGPLVGAALALLGYNWLFAVSALISLLALIAMHWWVQEPRFHKRDEQGDVLR